MRWIALYAVLIAALGLASCGSTAAASIGSIQVYAPWARAALALTRANPADGTMSDTPRMDGATSAAYMLLKNNGSNSDTLIRVSSAVANTVELHTTAMKDGVMQMRPVEAGIEVPANGQVELKPGSFHVMLIGLKQDLTPGEQVVFTLEFAKAGTLDVRAAVRTN